MNANLVVEESELGWTDTLIVVCTKCGKQFANSSEQESPERIKQELKILTKEKFAKGVRVVTSSCLNICPKNKIAIARASSSSSNVFKAYAVDANASGTEIFNELIKDL